ncbi:MAG: MoaD/ThiS family protein [Planctomycetaceae bacterium]
MQITFQFEAQLSQVAGTRQQNVELPTGATVLSAIQHVAQDGSSALRERILNEDGSVQRSLMVFVNELPVPASETATRVLQDRDTVLFLPPISGG